MTTMQNRLSHLAVFAVAVGALLCSTSAVAREPSGLAGLGLSKEKPTSGRFVAVQGGYMVPYTATIPGTDVQFEMVPVPGGEFLMGSPDDEADRRDDEGPQVVGTSVDEPELG